MSLLGKIGLGCGGALAVLAFIGLAIFIANPVLIGRYWAVVTGADTVNRVDTLKPLETVPGSKSIARALPIAPPGTLDDSARIAAIQLADQTQSQSLIVWSKDGIVLEHYGKGFDQSSLSNPASMIKPVLALAVGAAIDRGLIKRNDPVGKFIPSWKDDPRGAITIEQLLTMSSGLAHAPFSLNPFSIYMTSWLDRDVNRIALSTKQAFPPGTHFQYSNLNAQVLTIALEAATGKRLSAWLSETIWQPIGAQDASVWLDREGGAARGFCCLIASARDWLRVGLLIKDQGRAEQKQVVSRDFIESMIAPSRQNPSFGFNLWRATPYVAARSYGDGISFKVPAAQPFLAPDMVYFDGNGGQRVYISQSLGLVIVRIGAPKMDWDDSKLPNIIVKGLKTETEK